jgi:ribosome-binding factor A
LGGIGKEDVLKILARNQGELRRAVGKQLSLKYAPEFRFRLDETFDRMDNSRRLFTKESIRRDLEE